MTHSAHRKAIVCDAGEENVWYKKKESGIKFAFHGFPTRFLHWLSLELVGHTMRKIRTIIKIWSDITIFPDGAEKSQSQLYLCSMDHSF